MGVISDPWWWSAECAKPEKSWVFVKTELHPSYRHLLQAKGICLSCPVLDQCRADVLQVEGGLVKGEAVGVRAGMGSHARAKITSQFCRQCRTAKRLPRISFCAECRQERRDRRRWEALGVA